MKQPKHKKKTHIHAPQQSISPISISTDSIAKRSVDINRFSDFDE